MLHIASGTIQKLVGSAYVPIRFRSQAIAESTKPLVLVMADRITREQRSANMRAIRSKGMKPEMAVRRLAHSLGFRFRLHRKDLPGNPDLVFSSRRKVIFVHGCFWHQHPNPHCKAAHAPRSNTSYWGPKLERNSRRDVTTQNQLLKLGWGVLVLWECELKDTRALEERLLNYLS